MWQSCNFPPNLEFIKCQRISDELLRINISISVNHECICTSSPLPSATSAKKLNKNKFKYNGHSLVSYTCILFIYICFALSADSLTCWKTWFTCTELVHAQTMKLLGLEDMLKIMMTFMLHKMLH